MESSAIHGVLQKPRCDARPSRIAAVACLAMAVIACCVVAGCRKENTRRIQGYIEGEFVYVSSPMAGSVESLQCQRGAQVRAGDLLFSLESVRERASQEEARRRAANARSILADLNKGMRPSEIEALDAQLRQARATLALAEKDLAREEELVRTRVATVQELDRARTLNDQSRQRVAQIEAELQTARLGARPDQINAAEENARAAEAAVARADWELQQKRQSAPQDGLVFDTLYREGEWVAAGRPVAVLLPPSHVKLRAFVPEHRVAAIHAGDTLQVLVDGRSNSLPAKVAFVSPRAEYTPPVIYSRESRSKLVFMIEATFEPSVAGTLHPGQPVDIDLP